jgi:uncharacterized protein YbaA (DUF1428 family)
MNTTDLANETLEIPASWDHEFEIKSRRRPHAAVHHIRYHEIDDLILVEKYNDRGQLVHSLLNEPDCRKELWYEGKTAQTIGMREVRKFNSKKFLTEVFCDGKSHVTQRDAELTEEGLIVCCKAKTRAGSVVISESTSSYKADGTPNFTNCWYRDVTTGRVTRQEQTIWHDRDVPALRETIHFSAEGSRVALTKVMHNSIGTAIWEEVQHFCPDSGRLTKKEIVLHKEDKTATVDAVEYSAQGVEFNKRTYALSSQ